MATLNSFRELRVYQEMRRLHLDVNRASLAFPKYEMFELWSQVRRSSPGGMLSLRSRRHRIVVGDCCGNHRGSD
ncbi:MAG: four helix bundle protein, partial [Lentisphaerae bacterium]|nr:four helix bundle protein [Lentisphaerota bacterium]